MTEKKHEYYKCAGGCGNDVGSEGQECNWCASKRIVHEACNDNPTGQENPTGFSDRVMKGFLQ